MAQHAEAVTDACWEARPKDAGTAGTDAVAAANRPLSPSQRCLSVPAAQRLDTSNAAGSGRFLLEFVGLETSPVGASGRMPRSPFTSLRPASSREAPLGLQLAFVHKRNF